MRHRPSNIKPYAKLRHYLKKRLISTCKPDDCDQEVRLWFPSAWVDWLLWDFRTAKETSAGFKEIIIESVARYKEENASNATYYTKAGIAVPNDWIQDSINALTRGGWVIPNYRSKLELRLKPCSRLMKIFNTLEDLERAYDPYAINSQHSNEAILRRLERLEAAIAAIGGIVGLPPGHI